MNSKEKLKMAIYAGEIMLKSGGETYRVEDTILHILKSGHIKNADAFVTPTGIFASIEDDDDIVSIVKSVHTSNINLEKVSMVNALSRMFTSGEVNIDEGLTFLQYIDGLKEYPTLRKSLATGCACLGFGYILSHSAIDAFVALLLGICLGFLMDKINHTKMSAFLINVVGGAFISLFALTFASLGICEMDYVIIGGIMPLVPGVSIVNALRDIILGDFLSGTSRISHSITVALGIAIGVYSILSIWLQIFGGFYSFL